MSLAQGNNTPTRPRIEPGSPDPESNTLTTRSVRSPMKLFEEIQLCMCVFLENYTVREIEEIQSEICVCECVFSWKSIR